MKHAGLIPIFHPWKLHLAPNNLFPGQVLLLESSISIQNNDNDNVHDEWEVLDRIDYHKTKKYKIQYKATYIGNWEEWNAAPTWQPWKDFENAKEKISKFDRKHSKKRTAPPELTSSNKYDPETVY